MIKKAQLNFNRLPEEKFDDAMGVSTGAAVIFGATGGVMEAALRTAADLLTGESQDSIEYTEIRGTEGFKEAVYKVAGMDVKVAVVSGLSNADALLKKVRAGEADYQFIEVHVLPRRLCQRRRPAHPKLHQSQLLRHQEAARPGPV